MVIETQGKAGFSRAAQNSSTKLVTVENGYCVP